LHTSLATLPNGQRGVLVTVPTRTADNGP